LSGYATNRDLGNAAHYFYNEGRGEILSWLEFAENPEAASSLFDPPPSLQNVEVFTFKIDRDGPAAELTIALNEYPSSPPLKWRTQQANAVTMTLQLLALGDVEVKGWSTTNRAEMQIARVNAEQLEIVAKGTNFTIRATFGFLRIIGFSPYHYSA